MNEHIKSNFNRDRKQDKDLNFLQAFLLIAITLALVIIIGRQFLKAIDRHALATCEYYNDCSEVIRHLNR